MKIYYFIFLNILLTTSLIGQTDVNSDRYCVIQRKIYDFNTSKKLKNKQALKLLKPYPKAYNFYNKSIKQMNLAIGSGIAFVGFTAYYAGSEDMKREDIGDYTGTQKVVLGGFITSAAVFITSLIIHDGNRTKSLLEFNKIIENGSNSYLDGDHGESKIVGVRIDPLTFGMHITF